MECVQLQPNRLGETNICYLFSSLMPGSDCRLISDLISPSGKLADQGCSAQIIWPDYFVLMYEWFRHLIWTLTVCSETHWGPDDDLYQTWMFETYVLYSFSDFFFIPDSSRATSHVQLSEKLQTPRPPAYLALCINLLHVWIWGQIQDAIYTQMVDFPNCVFYLSRANKRSKGWRRDIVGKQRWSDFCIIRNS